MSNNRVLRTQWLVSGQLAFFAQSCNQISRVEPFGAGFLYFDAANPTLISAEGEILWRNKDEQAKGTGLGQAVISSDRIAFVGSWDDRWDDLEDRSVPPCYFRLKIMDAKGVLCHSVPLGAALEAPLTIDTNNGLIFGGTGTYRCALFCASIDGQLRWKHDIHEIGFEHASVLGANGALWVPTGKDGLWCVDTLTGEPLSAHPDANKLLCLSSLVLTCDGFLVVGAFGSFPCALIKLSREGEVLSTWPLPDLASAQLFLLTDGSVWVVGKTNWHSDYSELEPGDRIHVLRISASGEQLAAIELPCQVAIDAAVAPDGNLWIGTYSDDETGDFGELYVVSLEGRVLACWAPDNPRCGFGMPVLLSNHRAIVPTTMGVVCVQLSE